MTLKLDHVVLEVRDPVASTAFYQAVLGLAPLRLEAYQAGEAPFPSGRVDAGTILDFFPPPLWGSRRRADNPNHLCFALSARELSTVQQRLRRRKIPVLRRSRRNYGARGWGRSVYFEDPDGVTLEARTYEGMKP